MGQSSNKSTAKLDLIVGSGIVLALFGLAAYADLLEWWIAWTAQHEEWELDEILTAAALSTVCFAWYSFRRWRESQREIAAREETERTLRESEERLRLASRLNKIRSWTWSGETRATRYLSNQGDIQDSLCRAASQTSSAEEELLQAIHPDDRRHVSACWDRACAEHVPYEIEYRLVSPDGVVRYNHEIGTPEIDESGRYLGHFGTTQNVTDRKRAEEARMESEQMFSKAFHASPALLAISKIEDGTHYDVNETWMSTLGYSHAEAMAHSALELGVWADTGQREEFVERLKKERSVRAFEATFRTKGGKLLDFLVSGEFIELGGEVRLLVASQDMTERVAAERALRENEERLRQASELAKIGYYVWDAVQDRCTYCSEYHAGIHGLTPEEYISRASVLGGSFSLTHPDDREAVHEAFKRLRSGKRIEIEYRTVTPSGKTRYVRENAEPIFDGNGRVVREIGATQDITEIKRSETLLKRALDASSAYCALFDADNRLIVCNEMYRKTNETPGVPIEPGVPMERIVRAFADHVGVGQSEAETEAWIARRLDRRNAPAQSYEYQRSDGQWIEVSDNVLEDGSLFTIGLVVTERKRMESALSQREAYLKAFIDHSSAEIGIKDTEGRYVFVNPVALRHMRAPAEEVIGKTSRDVFPEDVAAQVLAQDREVLETGKPVRKEIVVDNMHDGPRIYSAVKFPIYDAEGLLTGVGAIATDVTELKRVEERLRESEERFRGLVDNLPLSIVLRDIDGRYVLVNKTFETRYQITFAQVAGKTDFDLHPKETAELFAQHDKAVLASGETVTNEFPIAFADGTMHSVLVTKFPIKDAQGKVSSIGSIGMDITERKQVEDQLRQAQKMDALGQLTGGVAHDFNNMLAAIIGNLEMLGDHLDGNTAKRSWDIAFQAALSAAGLTERLLTFARQERAEHAALDLRAALLDMQSLLRTTLGETIELHMRLPEDTWAVWGDIAQLQNAMINLAANAEDAMPKGGRFTIEAANADFDEAYCAQHPDIAPGSYVVLSVSDTGDGMPPEVIARVFDPFFTTKEVGKGTGLGLSTIFGFMKQLGGHVELESEEGLGTCFRLYLPAAASPEEDSHQSAAHEKKSPRGSETILLVDDDAEVRETALALLANLGYSVIPAADGPSALAILDEGREVDLVFTDTVMPGGMTGLELAREVLNRFPNLKVLRTSGRSSSSENAELQIESEIEWIAKPYLQRALAEKIRRVLDEPATSVDAVSRSTGTA